MPRISMSLLHRAIYFTGLYISIRLVQATSFRKDSYFSEPGNSIVRLFFGCNAA